eukprot:1516834-Rhodomonas_salina.2
MKSSPWTVSVSPWTARVSPWTARLRVNALTKGCSEAGVLGGQRCGAGLLHLERDPTDRAECELTQWDAVPGVGDDEDASGGQVHCVASRSPQAFDPSKSRARAREC